MSSEEPVQATAVEAPTATEDSQMQELPTGPAAMIAGAKKRPRLDLTVNPRERKRGKSIFGLVLGTLNKAKIEDKERNASEAARKRQLIEQRLQNKLKQETDSVRRAEEAKKDKTTANRKEEDLQLKDSIHKLRRIRFPLLANFLLTSDVILDDPSSEPQNPLSVLSQPLRSHPPPLYYLPVVLTPAQEAFLARRKTEVEDAAEKEWAAFRAERTSGIEEIHQLRQRVADEEARKKALKDAEKEDGSGGGEGGEDGHMDKEMADDAGEPRHDVEMDVDDSVGAEGNEVGHGDGNDSGKGGRNQSPERREELVAISTPAPGHMQADDDDAVEY